jgi:hypothetical protein
MPTRKNSGKGKAKAKTKTKQVKDVEEPPHGDVSSGNEGEDAYEGWASVLVKGRVGKEFAEAAKTSVDGSTPSSFGEMMMKAESVIGTGINRAFDWKSGGSDAAIKYLDQFFPLTPDARACLPSGYTEIAFWIRNHVVVSTIQDTQGEELQSNPVFALSMDILREHVDDWTEEETWSALDHFAPAGTGRLDCEKGTLPHGIARMVAHLALRDWFGNSQQDLLHNSQTCQDVADMCDRELPDGATLATLLRTINQFDPLATAGAGDKAAAGAGLAATIKSYTEDESDGDSSSTAGRYHRQLNEKRTGKVRSRAAAEGETGGGISKFSRMEAPQRMDVENAGWTDSDATPREDDRESTSAAARESKRLASNISAEVARKLSAVQAAALGKLEEVPGSKNFARSTNDMYRTGTAPPRQAFIAVMNAFHNHAGDTDVANLHAVRSFLNDCQDTLVEKKVCNISAKHFWLGSPWTGTPFRWTL